MSKQQQSLYTHANTHENATTVRKQLQCRTKPLLSRVTPEAGQEVNESIEGSSQSADESQSKPDTNELYQKKAMQCQAA